ncbi:MAG: Xaa-Pro peptidase family protein [Chitinophagaceae bacterium]|jgi:Xaa-Pro dipeptidase|nr:Xaa-Pro peptidase family protein [Chitinophagaceae bacterium]MCF8421494.1 Xaa-Pro peptidase family protein [Chitinophagaceae bacterium]
MSQNRRKFLSTAFLTAGTLGLSGKVFANDSANQYDFNLPKSIEDLVPMKEGVVPITVEERKQRIAKAQSIMEQEKIDAIFLEGTVSCFYFTGMRWGQSERTFGVVIPAKGPIAYVCPKFEEDRAMELLNPVFGDEVRCWEEHESPYALIFNIIKDRGTKYKKIGMEERVRFFIADGVKKLATGFDIVDATPVTAGCRMYKTKAELDLMQYSSDVTIKAYQAAFATIRPDMSQSEFSGNISAAFRKLGYSGGASVQVGKYSALPHGSITPQVIREGDIVMVDGGTSVEGYASDITRTIVVGKPSQRQIDVWNIELEAQNAAFAAIKIGAPCEVVDAAARAVIEKAGFKSNYKLPGLPHRTGHGIGLEGHEWTNFVKGNKTPLAVGMCFSNEPTISIPGEFGIRLEDCLYIAEDGPHYFSKQSISIEQPFG